MVIKMANRRKTPAKQQNALSEIDPNIKMHNLDLAFSRSVADMKLIAKDEENRRARVNTLLEQHDKDDLQARANEMQELLSRVEKSRLEVQQQLQDAENELYSINEKLRIERREKDTLKNELATLEQTAGESSKTRAENLALNKEVANLRMELSHRVSESKYQQNLLTEKLTLERQIGSLEAELQAANQAVERARRKELEQLEKNEAVHEQLAELTRNVQVERQLREKVERNVTVREEEWGQQLEDVKREVEMRREEWNKQRRLLEREMRSKEEEWERQREMLERDMEAKEEQWRQEKAALEKKARSKPTTATNDVMRNKPQLLPTAQPRVDDEMLMATPGPPARTKGKADKGKGERQSGTMPGEKSTFSMTPFINNKTVLFDTAEDDEENEDAGPVQAQAKKGKAKAPAKPRAKKGAAREDEDTAPTAANLLKGKGRRQQRLLPRQKPNKSILDDDTDEDGQGGDDLFSAFSLKAQISPRKRKR